MGLKSKSLDLVRPSVPVHEVTKEDMVRINMNVPKSVRQNWKFAALERDLPMTDLIIEAMNTYLSKDISK
jgi:hypothetical protein